jgi:hypothetical protein
LVIQSSRTLLSVFLRMGSNLLVFVSSEHSLISNVLMIFSHYLSPPSFFWNSKILLETQTLSIRVIYLSSLPICPL